MTKILMIIVLLVTGFVFGAGKSPVSQTVKDSQELQILSQPRPSYTDEARRSKVEGWVRLKVTFQANGEIGEVVYVAESSRKKKLTKRGLVDQAIEAAKKIKFTPAKDENDIPLTVTKTVEYIFTIY